MSNADVRVDPTTPQADAALRSARAALALLDAQHPAEALRLARRALAALRPGADAERASAIDAALARPARRLDREVTPGDLRAARDALRSVLEGGPESVRRRVGVTTALAVLAAAVCTANALRPAPPLRARASAVYAELPALGPAMAIDGDPETSWLLPNETEGTLDVELRAPRRIERLHVLSTHNGAYDDRATREYVVELARGPRVVREERGSFTWAGRNEPNEHVLGEDGIDRIRIRIESWHRQGGGIAELEIE